MAFLYKTLTFIVSTKISEEWQLLQWGQSSGGVLHRAKVTSVLNGLAQNRIMSGESLFPPWTPVYSFFILYSTDALQRPKMLEQGGYNIELNTSSFAHIIQLRSHINTPLFTLQQGLTAMNKINLRSYNVLVFQLEPWNIFPPKFSIHSSFVTNFKKFATNFLVETCNRAVLYEREHTACALQWLLRVSARGRASTFDAIYAPRQRRLPGCCSWAVVNTRDLPKMHCRGCDVMLGTPVQ